MAPAKLRAPTFRELLVRGLANLPLLLTIFAAVALTFALSRSGIDAMVNTLARLQDPTISMAWSAFPMLAGFAVPLLIPVTCALRGQRDLAKATSAALAASLIVVSILKGVTSRVHPEALVPESILAKSQAFSFGLFEAGFLSVVEGWPSGHMATNGAVLIVFAGLATRAWYKVASWLWLAWIALATVFGISGDVHWLSDTVSGGLLAVVIASQILIVFRTP